MTIFSVLPREAQLLFLCARGPEYDSEIRRLCAEGIAWDAFLDLARRESAEPLLWRRLQGLGDALLPPPAADRLRRLARVTEFKMLYLEQRVLDSVKALSAVGVESVLLKGAALATRVHGGFANRPMTDFDVLVRRAEAPEALAVLLRSGWLWRSDRDPDGDYSHLHHLPALLDARGMEISLELHTALFPSGHPFALLGDHLLDGAQAVAGMPTGLRVPAPEHMLLHLATHFAWSNLLRKGGWKGFRDARGIIAAFAPLDWDRVVAEARRARATTSCYWTFRLANELMDVGVPAEVLASLRPSTAGIEFLARHFALVMFPLQTDCPSVSLRRLMWSAGMQPRRSGHGKARPWEVLALKEEDRHRDEVRASIRRASGLTTRGAWGSYLSRLVSRGTGASSAPSTGLRSA